MQRHQFSSLHYYTFDSFERHGLVHGLYTRRGGISPAPWASLNLGGTTGDERANVVENRRRIFESVSRPVESIFDSWQVHGTEVICVTEPRPLDGLHQKGDVILTDQSDITLFMRFADCVPVMLFDPVKRVIGIVHAGWRGTVDRAAGAAVAKMGEVYGSNPSELVAGIGPSICVEHYEVGEDVTTAAMDSFGDRIAKDFIWQNNGSAHFDLWRANHFVLEQAGVRQIEHAALCTYHHNDDWYSHRAEHGRTGRYGALLALPRQSDGQ